MEEEHSVPVRPGPYARSDVAFAHMPMVAGYGVVS